MKKNKKHVVSFLGLAFLLVGINVVAQFVFKRFDVTQDQRYTLSPATLKIINEVKEPLHIDVYLEGSFPAEFRKLKEETKQLLEEFSAYNSHIYFTFSNPLSNPETADKTAATLFASGMKPLSVNVNDKGKQTQEMVFPWAVAGYKGKQAKIPLIKNMMGSSIEEKINVSVQHLEYAVTEAIQKVVVPKTKKIAVIKGIGEPHDVYLADLLMTLRESYYIAPFSLDSVAQSPEKVLTDLKGYDLALIAKPSLPFSDAKIQVLDQYIMNGGKTLWMIDEVQADMDSLYRKEGMMAYPKDMGDLGQLFFKYGLRINPVLVKDEIATPIKLAVGQQGSETVYDNFMWKFAPYVVPQSQHPIVKNVDGIKFDFAGSIDTLKNGIKKTVLLQSSPYAMAVGTPLQVSLDMVNDKTAPEVYKGKGNLPLAVLLEGSFTSVYKNRILPFRQNAFKDKSIANKLVVIADGDIARNQLDQNKMPLELGYDKWTNTLFGNKEFMLNTVNYLLDDNGLINIRTKDVKLALLHKEKVYDAYRKIQLLNMGLPIVLLVVLGVVFMRWRKKAYQK